MFIELPFVTFEKLNNSGGRISAEYSWDQEEEEKKVGELITPAEREKGRSVIKD